MTSTKAGRPGLVALSVLVLAMLSAGLLSSCGARYDFEGDSLLSYAEAGSPDGLVLNLSRDRESVFGTWEDPANSRFGLVEGDAKADASLQLRFYGAVTAVPAGALQGRYVEGESRIEATVAFGSEDAREVTLAPLPERTSGLRTFGLSTSTREGLPAAETDPTRFIYLGFEPTKPAALRDAYRKTFQGGLELKAIMTQERDDFIEDFKGTTAEIKASLGDSAVHAWYYEGRQVISYRKDGLLVMALRRGIFTGTADPSQAIRHAVIDEETGKILGPGDFLVEGWEEKLPALLAASLREELGLDPERSFIEQGLAFEEPPVSSDFLVYSKGLGFHYPSGNLVAAKAGELFVLLPFDRLEGLLRPEAVSRWKLAAESPAEGATK